MEEDEGELEEHEKELEENEVVMHPSYSAASCYKSITQGINLNFIIIILSYDISALRGLHQVRLTTSCNYSLTISCNYS